MPISLLTTNETITANLVWPELTNNTAVPAMAQSYTGASTVSYTWAGIPVYNAPTLGPGTTYLVDLNALADQTSQLAISFREITVAAQTAADSFRAYGTYGSSFVARLAQHPPEHYERERRRRARASKRGRKLLVALLSDSQKREYAATQCFTVVGANGLAYRLRKRRTAELIGHDGGSVANYCIHLAGDYCPEDNLIAQKFLLENDPDEFERIANITVIRHHLYEQIRSGQLHLRAA